MIRTGMILFTQASRRRERRTPGKRSRVARTLLAQGEGENDRHPHVHGRAVAQARFENPSLRRRDRSVLEAKARLRRADDANVADAAVREHDDVELDLALHFGQHRFAGVVRLRGEHRHRLGRIDADGAESVADRRAVPRTGAWTPARTEARTLPAAARAG